jgi:hypothetical protein
MGGWTAPMFPGGRAAASSSDRRALARAVSLSERATVQRKPGPSRRLAIVVIGSRARLLAVDPSNRAARHDIPDQGHGQPGPQQQPTEARNDREPD